MRLPMLFTILTLSFPATLFAQDMMPKVGGNMGQPMTSDAMPENGEDTRQIVPLTETERRMVAAEMRQMLASVQGITDGLARGNLQVVIEAASKSGMAMMQHVPMQIRMKFPAPFSQMGMASHQAFDRIAKETKSIKDPAPVLKQLSAGMQSCIACHATYRFAPPKEKMRADRYEEGARNVRLTPKLTNHLIRMQAPGFSPLSAIRE
ncbi:MAG: hypothetical protein ABL892_09235 [Thiobacillaceae bacterium]